MTLTLGLVLARKDQRINLQKVKGIPIVPSFTITSWATQVRKDHSTANIMLDSRLSSSVQQRKAAVHLLHQTNWKTEHFFMARKTS